MQGEDLAALLWAYHDAIGYGMSQQLMHGVVVHCCQGQIIVLGIALQQPWRPKKRPMRSAIAWVSSVSSSLVGAFTQWDWSGESVSAFE